MAETTDNDAETTEQNSQFSVIDATLASLRITGSVLLRESYAAPWAIAIPEKHALAELLATHANVRVVAFHLVELGHCSLKVNGEKEILLTAGEMAVCFGGAAHQLSLGDAKTNIDLLGLISQRNNPRDPQRLGLPTGTSLLCGAFLLQDTQLNPLFNALPAVLHVAPTRHGALHNLTGVARMIIDELDKHMPASGFIVARLLEVLCAEAIRSHVSANTSVHTNWFRGVNDQIVGRAISAIHRQPGASWSVQQLAHGVAMSPSRFAARFAEVVGESPMAYVTKWRMYLACQSLKSGRQNVEQLARSLGYESQAAFSRAFRKWLGVSPAAWRAQQAAAS